MRKEFLEKIELTLRIIAIVLGGTWVVSTYWYEKEIEPKKDPSFLNITAEIKKVGELRNNEVYKIKVTFQNKSKIREKLIASWFHLVGYNFDFNVDTMLALDCPNFPQIIKQRRFVPAESPAPKPARGGTRR